MPNKYSQYLKIWISEFKNKLIVSRNETGIFYVLNKDFFFDYPEKGTVNKKLLKINEEGKYIINPDKTFFILDKYTWQIIKNDYQNEEELEIKYEINNNKCVLQIDWHIYYFYFIINDNIEEGYFKFFEHKIADAILAKFYELKIENFFKEMNINTNIIKNELQTIKTKKNEYFYCRIKSKDNQIENGLHNNFKRNINTRKDIKIINEHKNDSIGFNIRKDKPIIINENKFNNQVNIDNNSLKIYKCIYYYFQFEKEINSNTNNDLNLKLFLIDKIWLNNFKKKMQL